MATLGDIKWGAQYKVVASNEATATKTVNGLNLDESATPAAESANAATVNELVRDMLAMGEDRLTEVNLIETREVKNNV